MAETIVDEIITSAKTLIASTIGPDFTQLDYEYEIEKNNFKRGKRYGFIPDGADFVPERVLKSQTFDHTFQLIITLDFYNNDDDSKQREATSTVFEFSHDLMKVMINKKLGLPSKVLLVTGISIEAPEFLVKNSIVALRTNLNVQYRYRTLPL